MRTRKEILQLLLDNINLLQFGLCGLAWRLNNLRMISLEECLDIREYIKSQRPKKTYKQYNYIRLNYDYYWKPGNAKPRIAWLKKHIELNSNVNNK
jgi:hypothetical protein